MLNWMHLDPACSVQKLTAADTLIGQIVQIIALTGENMVDHRSDMRHLSMTWNADNKTLDGELFRIEDREYQIAFKVDNFSLEMKDRNNNSLSSFEMDGKNFKQALLWWEDALKEIGVHKNYLITCLPYKSEPHLFQSNTPIEKPADHILNEWNKTRNNATEALKDLAKSIHINTPVLTRPRNLDTAIAVPFTDKDKNTNTSFEAGWTMTGSPKPAFFIKSQDSAIINFGNKEYERGQFEKWPGENALILSIDKLYIQEAPALISEFFYLLNSQINSSLQQAG
ncbi:MAG TPA: hypothetical protein VE912_13380 [Bacteroidales bacterium]|nr:hypothetical protein [Bacteroidales bacterium]